ncbi:hypothetical protein [Xylophilus ampelinus]|uniref:Uncharacterized protein n=1 Tax=Xylophilus ampelinus TaxID=54067 RepID=A0A318SLH1_9BURK|nr:hypothetical protein [Xylophilus ampelinus]MCS4509127.1 hypothetical protein [Xylophilus ampelinus]PYE79845.1 hypothetical protein DFQ15_101165 [Xylophilus ampelinus]
MPTITEAIRPYETLIRHNPDGTIGSHHITISEVLRDGNVIAATANPPTAIAGADLDAVLGQATVAALVQVDSLKSVLATQTNAHAALMQQHEDLRVQAQAVAADNAELRHQAALALQTQDLQAQLAATSAERSALSLQVQELQAQLAQRDAA